jgi:ribosomal protein L16 Arg81 hydroxylase
MREYYEKKPLHIARKDPIYYTKWFDVESFLGLLEEIPPDKLMVTAVLNEQTSRPPTLQKTVELMDKGASLVIPFLNSLSRSVGALCRHFEAFVYHPIQANGYYTPPGLQGFPVHYDGHDVFIVQIHGAKAWKVYDSEFPWPLDRSAPRIDPDKPRKLLIDSVVGPGDLLYMPRGFPHEGVAVHNATSLHLSVGLNQRCWYDVLSNVAEEIADQHPELRQPVPMGPLARQGGDLNAGLKAAQEAVATFMRQYLVAEAERRFILNRPVLSPGLVPVEKKRTIDGATKVRRHPLVLWRLERQEDATQLYFQGRSARYPLAAAPVLELLLAQEGEFSAASLAGEVPESELLKRIQYLVEDGLLLPV